MSVTKPRVYGAPLHTRATLVQQQRSHQEHSSYTERTRGGALSLFRCCSPPDSHRACLPLLKAC